MKKKKKKEKEGLYPFPEQNVSYECPDRKGWILNTRPLPLLPFRA